MDIATLGIRIDSREVTKADNALKKLGSTGTNTEKSFSKVGGSIGSSMALVARFAGIAGIALSAGAALKYAEAWTEIENRLRLATNGVDELNKSMSAVYRISQATNSELGSTAQVYQRFAQNANELGISLDQVATLSETVAKAVAISGASAGAAEASLVQFGQALASGVLRGDELNSIMEQTPGLAQAIATGMGVSVGALRQLGAEGKITGDVLIESLNKAKESVDEQFSTRVMTLSQSFTNLGNALTQFFGEANNATGITSLLAQGVLLIVDAVEWATERVKAFGDGFQYIKAMLSDGWDIVYKAFEIVINNTIEDFKRLGKFVTDIMNDIGLTTDEKTGDMKTSFTDFLVESGRELDMFAGMFTGVAAAVEAAWSATTNNIGVFFSNLWASVLSGAESAINYMIEGLNKVASLLPGATSIERVSFGGGSGVGQYQSISEAAASAYAANSSGIGAEAYVQGVIDRVKKKQQQKRPPEILRAALGQTEVRAAEPARRAAQSPTLQVTTSNSYKSKSAFSAR